MKAVRGKAFSLNQTDHAQGHILPDVETWLRLGIEGLRAKVHAARRQPAMQAPEKQIFYDAAEIALTAAQTLIERYADLAAEMAQREPDPQRAAELTQIAANCRHLATDAPETFYQALQAVWFLFVLVQIESNASSFSPGRFDQYMLPYLLADLQIGAADAGAGAGTAGGTSGSSSTRSCFCAAAAAHATLPAFPSASILPSAAS